MPSQRLLTAARERRLVLFAGAGVSMAAPTALPSWWDLNQAVVGQLGERAAGVLPMAREFAQLVVARQQAELLPPDYVAEKIVHTVGAQYFDVLRCVDSDRPNATHLALAELAAAGELRAIVTTNFDRAIEAAFAARGAALDVHADGDAAGALLARWAQFEQRSLPCQLIKLHGTADRPATILDTLAQRARGPAPQFLECVARLCAFGEFGFVGFSGADLETQPDYLGLRRAAGSGRGFTWLVQRGKEPRQGVVGLVDAWKGRAEWLHGDLPGALADLLDGAQPLAPRSSASAPVDVASYAAEWAQQIPEGRALCIIAELLQTAGRSDRARELLDAFVATLPQSQWKLKHAVRDGQVVVWAEGAPGEEQDGPFGIGDRAKPTLAVLSPRCDLSKEERKTCCNAWFGLADVADHLGDRDASVEALLRSLIEAIAVRERTYQVRALGVLADHFAQDGKRDQAEALYAAAVALCGERPLTRGNLMTNRARNAIAAGGRERQAFEWLTLAARDFAAIGDERGRAGTLLGLADLSLRGAATTQAAQLFGQALDFGQRVGDAPIVYEAWLGIGRAALAERRAEVIEPAFERALEAARAMGDAERERTALGWLERVRAQG